MTEKAKILPIWRIAAFPLVIAFECFLLLYVYHCIRPFLGIVFFCPIICTFISEVKMAGDEVEPEAKYCSERKGSLSLSYQNYYPHYLIMTIIIHYYYHYH